MRANRTMVATSPRAYRPSMDNVTATKAPAARPRRPMSREPRSFAQPRENDQLTDSQRKAARGRAAARHDALIVAWLRALGRT